ncbi:MAG: carboxypeptidase-like regulatory domain-containing protein [Aureispira sp.]|nr:carboxypeptidase-like regulatory domain-containing protein [Aureispira sp.]
MKQAYIYILSVLIWGAITKPSFAQKKSIIVFGKVVDKKSQQPIEFATVMLGHKETKKVLTGVTTLTDGSFELKADSNNFYVEISFIGFEKKVIEDIVLVKGKVDLGLIELSDDSQLIDDVEVRGERSQMEFKLDKKVFNVL